MDASFSNNNPVGANPGSIGPDDHDPTHHTNLGFDRKCIFGYCGRNWHGLILSMVFRRLAYFWSKRAYLCGQLGFLQ
jgi:hypothetical protein